MADPISINEFRELNAISSAGLRAPMAKVGESSLRSFVRRRTPNWDTVRGLFTDDDRDHMRLGDPDDPPGTVPTYLFNLNDYTETRERARAILDLVSSKNDKLRMPKPPTKAWTGSHIKLFHRWVAGGAPR